MDFQKDKDGGITITPEHMAAHLLQASIQYTLKYMNERLSKGEVVTDEEIQIITGAFNAGAEATLELIVKLSVFTRDMKPTQIRVAKTPHPRTDPEELKKYINRKNDEFNETVN